MNAPRDERQEEPNVVPLIDVSLVILVMALVITSLAGQLLTMDLPKAQQTQFVEASQTAGLTVAPDGTFQLGPRSKLARSDLAAALAELDGGTIVLIGTEAGARYEQVVTAIDAVTGRPGLKVAFGKMAPRQNSWVNFLGKSGSLTTGSSSLFGER